MRIAFVAPFGLRAKGTTRARVLPLARELARRGHTAAVFVPPYDSPEDSGLRWIEAAAMALSGGRPGEGQVGTKDVAVFNVTLPVFGRGGAFFHLRVGERLFRAVREWRPDVVHVFKPKGPSGLVGAAFWVMRRLTAGDPRACVFLAQHPPVVIDSDDWEGAGGWNDDVRAGYSALQRRFFAWQERFGLSHADAWTVTSECLRARALGFGARPDRIFTLHNGTRAISDQRAVASGQPSAIGHPLSAILYTRFAGTRAVDVAAIWARVRERVPEAKLAVVGRGLGGEERELVGVPGITVQGWVEPAELPAFLSRMSVALAPWADTPPNRARHSAKVLELMAAGLPIVAYAVGELPVTLGEAGVLVPPGDAEGFATAVAVLLAEPDRAVRLGAMAQTRAESVFAWDRLADVALAAYAAAGSS